MQSVSIIRENLKETVAISSSHHELFSGNEDLSPKIKNQQIAFDNECKFLIFAVLKNRQDVEDVMENWSHTSPKYSKLANELEIILANYWSTCVKVLTICQENSVKLHQRVNVLIEDYKNAHDERIRWDWHEISAGEATEDLLRIVQKLRHSIDMLRAIFSVALPTRQQPTIDSPCTHDTRPNTDQGRTATYRNLPHWAHRAPQILWETISKVWRCNRHHSHSLSISLDDRAARNCSKSLSHFNVAMTSPLFVRRYSVIVQKDVPCRYKATRGEQSLGKHGDTRRSKLDKRNFGSNMCPWHDLGPLSTMAQSNMRDLSLETDFCDYLLDSPSVTRLDADLKYSCLGYLKSEIGLRFIFVCSAESSNDPSRLESLSRLFLRADLEHRLIPVAAKLRTAILVATGSLDLHDTPWFPQTWSCDNIYFYLDKLDDWEDTLEDPYLQTELLKYTDQPLSIGDPPSVETSMLYCLAVVLIELAFSSRWCNLQPQDHIIMDLLPREKELLTMANLSRTVSRVLGQRYAKVVRICLFYGCKPTHSVTKAHFRHIISEHVVKELQELASTVTFSSGA